MNPRTVLSTLSAVALTATACGGPVEDSMLASLSAAADVSHVAKEKLPDARPPSSKATIAESPRTATPTAEVVIAGTLDARDPRSETATEPQPPPDGEQTAGFYGSFRYRLPVDAMSPNPAVPLRDFPLLVTIDEPVVVSAAASGSVGFFDHEGRALPAELVEQPPAGVMQAWVRLTFLASDEPRQIFVAADARPGLAPSTPAVWTDTYASVFHLAGDSSDADVVLGHQAQRDDACVTDGVVGAGWCFDGVDDCAQVPTSWALEMGEGSFTVSFWMRGESGDAPSGVAVQNGSSPVFAGYAVELDGDASDVLASISDGSAWRGKRTASTAPGWHHVAAVVQRAPAYAGLELYVDGESTGRVPLAESFASVADLDTDLFLGCAFGDRDFFRGALDEVRVVRGARSSEWIAATHNNLRAASAVPLTGELEDASD